MIKDKLENAHVYDGMHKNFRMVFEILQSLNFDALEPGRIELDGNYVYINVDDAKWKKESEARLESHRKYIDIQLTLDHKERIGIGRTAEMKDIAEAYDEKRDIEFYGDKIEEWVEIERGEFVIFMPEDAHAPLVGEGDGHRKIVVKVSLVPNQEKPVL